MDQRKKEVSTRMECAAQSGKPPAFSATPAAESRAAFAERRPWFWDAAAACVFVLGLIRLWFLPWNHDTAWGVVAAGKILDGAQLYIDVVEINLPLALWHYIPSAALARLIGASETFAFHLYVVALIAASFLLSRKVLAEAWSDWPASVRGSLLALLPALLLPLAKYDFAQREHLMLLAALPYLLAAAGRARGWRPGLGPALAVGLLGGFGFALKPHYLLPFVAVEVYLWFGAKQGPPWRRLESILIAAVIGLHVLLTLLLTPQYLELMKLMVRAYSAFSVEWKELLAGRHVGWPVAAAAACVFARPTEQTRRLRHLLLVALGATFVVAAAQFKGFDYHFHPSNALAILLTAVVLLGLTERSAAAEQLFRPRPVLLPFLLVLAVVGYACRETADASAVARKWRKTPAALLAPVVKEHAPGQYIWVACTSLLPSFPLVNNTGAKWASRFNHLLPLPVLFKGVQPPQDGGLPESRPEYRDIEEYFMNAITEDLARFRPALVMMDEREQKEKLELRGFDLRKYFQRDARFARLWEDYERIGQVAGFGVYKRKRAGPGVSMQSGAEPR